MEIGLPVTIEGKAYRVVALKKKLVRFEAFDDGQELILSLEEISTLYAQGRLVRTIKKEALTPEDYAAALRLDYRGLTEVDRRHAENLLPYIHAFVEERLRHHSQKTVLEELIDRVAADKQLSWKPNWRTLSDHLRRFIQARRDGRGPSDSSWLNTNVRARGNRAARFPDEVEKFIDTLLRESLQPGGRSLKRLQGVLSEYILQRNMSPDVEKKGKLPSIRTLERRRQDISEYDKTVLLEGRIKARQKCQPVKQAPTSDFPLSDVEVDHTRVDLGLLAATKGFYFGRPYLTLAIDRCTRMVLGYHLGFDPPSFRTLALCLRMVMTPKDLRLQSCPDIRNPWPAFGIPRRLTCDNGLEFHSDSFAHLIKRFNMSVTWTRKRAGDDKGTVERLFERMNDELFHRIAGTTLSNPQKRGDYNSEHNACITLNQLRGFIDRWIVDDYSVEYHAGLKGRPLPEWNRRIEEYNVAVMPDIDNVNMFLLPTKSRQLVREGVHLFGIKYGCDDNEELFVQMLNDPHKPPSMLINHDPSDITYVYVKDWRVEGRFLRLKARNQTVHGLSLHEWEHHSELARKEKNDEGKIYSSNILAARATMDVMLNDLSSRGKVRGSKVARFIEPAESILSKEILPPAMPANNFRQADPVENPVMPLDEDDFLRDCQKMGIW